MSPGCWGLPSASTEVWPEQNNTLPLPSTSSAWLNPKATDHVHGLTALRSTIRLLLRRVGVPSFAAPYRELSWSWFGHAGTQRATGSRSGRGGNPVFRVVRVEVPRVEEAR